MTNPPKYFIKWRTDDGYYIAFAERHFRNRHIEWDIEHSALFRLDGTIEAQVPGGSAEGNMENPSYDDVFRFVRDCDCGLTIADIDCNCEPGFLNPCGPIYFVDK